MGMPKGNPLAKVENLEHYQWPDPEDERICGKIHQMAKAFSREERLLGGRHRDTLWEKAYMLVGMQNMMIYFYTEPEFVREVLHRIMDFQLGIAKQYARLGVEIVRLGDDLGTQRGPLINPETVNEFLVPEYERLFRFYKERDVLAVFHSCGNIQSMLNTFMQLGVDVLNPVQATANDLDKVRNITQGKVALLGAVSSVTIMDGPIERITAEVRQRIWQLGQEGGYFCSPDQGLPFPEAHINAVHEAIEEYGHYPIRPPDAVDHQS
jgi:uroporphyrinogen decarboxylase